MYSYWWFLLVNNSNPSLLLEKKGQQNVIQDLKYLVTVEKQRTLMLPDKFFNNWALGVPAKHAPAAPYYPLMQAPELLPGLSWLPQHLYLTGISDWLKISYCKTHESHRWVSKGKVFSFFHSSHQSHQGCVWHLQLQMRYFLVVTIFSLSAPVPTVLPHVIFQRLPLYSVGFIKGKAMLSWMNDVLMAHSTL